MNPRELSEFLARQVAESPGITGPRLRFTCLLEFGSFIGEDEIRPALYSLIRSGQVVRAVHGRYFPGGGRAW
jgi:hypothetical protein